ncbi:hypothetical protein MTO96_031138, partial [Rhipicephalus appendiculatus]
WPGPDQNPMGAHGLLSLRSAGELGSRGSEHGHAGQFLSASAQAYFQLRQCVKTRPARDCVKRAADR